MKYVVGIDLGTSNCALACVEPALGAAAPIVDVPVPQMIRPGEASARPLMPSCLYLPAPGEFPEGSLQFRADLVVGELARWQASRVPLRAVTSAKSWLCHPGVDRQSPILPWGAPADVPRLSPVLAQTRLLEHLKLAWAAAHPEAPLEQQQVVLTVPASFDEGARALTLQAAREAHFDLEHLVLLEEPQAAFYDFTSRHRRSLATALAGVRLVLVVDVGGGTTDFSLVQVAMLPEGPALKRLAVGDHLLLGGDNMDGALARLAESRALGDKRFSSAQWAQAVQAARLAKEALLGAAPADRYTLAVASGGSRLLGSTVSAELGREEVEQLLVEGFFPAISPAQTVLPAPAGTGVVELGLNFAKDPAITRHLVSFLRTHAAAARTALGDAPPWALPRPDALLLNGGVFNSPRLTRALVDAVSSLWPSAPSLPLLSHDSLDLAVARGAAYSGLARRALGQKIGGGAPRAYYAVLDSDAPGRQGVCLIPRGLEEGEAVELTDRPFTLTLGRPVQFQLMSTTDDRLDRPGDVVSVEGEGFKALPPIHAVLQGAKGASVSVHLKAALTEVGTLSLAALAGVERWRLEFDVRGAARTEGTVTVESMPARFAEAVELIDRVYGTRPLPVGPKDVKNLSRSLEKVLGPRQSWRLPVLRELWTALFSGAARRRRSADHERVLFSLLGYCLRPGVGYPLDAWRCEQTFGLFKDKVQHHAEHAVWAEFWVLWRRIAPGLEEGAQLQLWQYLQPHLQRRVPPGPPPKEKLKGIAPEAVDEMVRCAASLELLPVAHKLQLGGWVAQRLKAGDVGGPWAWALGRLGARVPVHGATHRVIDAQTAGEWVELLAGVAHDTAPFAIAQLARRTGDRSRDLDDQARDRARQALTLARAPQAWLDQVEQVVALSVADEARALGDTLPLGLKLA